MPFRSELIAASIALALGALMMFAVQEWRHGAKYARLERDHATLLERQAQAVVETVLAAKRIEAQRVAAVEKQRDIAQKQNEALAADVAAGRDLSSRLRQQLDALRARAGGGDTAAAERSPGQPDIDTIGVLADMYEGLERHGRAVAEHADKLRIAGLACERSYDALHQ